MKTWNHPDVLVRFVLTFIHYYLILKEHCDPISSLTNRADMWAWEQILYIYYDKCIFKICSYL